MLHGLTRVIRQAARHVPEVLWAPAQAEAMVSLAGRFPAVAARTVGPVRAGIIGLEFRLAPGADQVDLTFPVIAEDRDIIVAMGADPVDGAWMHGDPAWSRILRFCREWADPEGLLHRHVELLWFELDVDGAQEGPGHPVPGVFVRLRPGGGARDWRGILSRVVEPLAGTAPAPGLAESFERCARALPPGVGVQVGLMLSRGSALVRLVVTSLGEEAMPGYLRHVGWPGEPDAFAATLAGLSTPRGVRVHPGASTLQLDLAAAGVLPRIAVEYNFDRAAQLRGPLVEDGFLELLAERGLCSPEKRAALRQLPGETLEPRAGICLVGHARQIHHVKVVVDPGGGAAEAKAYYGQSLSTRPLGQAAAPSRAAALQPA